MALKPDGLCVYETTIKQAAYNFSVSLILIPFFMILNFLNKKESKVICKREFEARICEAFVVEFYLKLRLTLRIITYLTYICWEINNYVIKSDIFRRFFICKNILKKLSCYHDNYFRTSCSEIQWFCQQGEGFCMHVFSSIINKIHTECNVSP